MKSSKILIKELGKYSRDKFFKEFCSARLPIEYSTVFSASKSGKFIGGAVIDRRSKESMFHLDLDSVYIYYFYLLPEYRGKGIAKKLIDIAIKEFRSIVIVTGSKLDASAEHIFEQKGFKVIGRLGKLKYWHLLTNKEYVLPNTYNWFCKPHGCKMLKEACLKRQNLAKLLPFTKNPNIQKYYRCKSCSDAYREI